MRRLSGKQAFTARNQPITFSDKSFSDKRKIATHFARAFTRPFPHRPNSATRRIMRLIHKKHKLGHKASLFTHNQVSEALKASRNSTTPSPDGCTVLQMKHLGPFGLRYLCRIFNLSYAHFRFSTIWNRTILLKSLKPGKPKEQEASYRPISLLCPAPKLLERLMLPLMIPHIHLADTQHGFRVESSTTTAFLPLAHQIFTGFNQNCPARRTMAMGVDFSYLPPSSAAFQTAPWILTLSDGSAYTYVVAWLRASTMGCSLAVLLSLRVPQGFVMSPALFNA